MSLKFEKPIVVFDLETTGTDVNVDRIIQFAAFRFVEGINRPPEEVGRIIVTVNPEREVPKEALEVTRLDPHAIAMSPTLDSFADRIEALFDGADVAGYNCRKFDVPLLRQEFARLGRRDPIGDAAILDGYDIFKSQFPQTLANAHEFYLGRPMANAHDAGADALGTWDVLWAQLVRHELTGTPSEIAATIRQPYLDDDRRWMRDAEGYVVICFGKEKGKRLGDLDHGYVDWMLSKFSAADCASIRAERNRTRRQPEPDLFTPNPAA